MTAATQQATCLMPRWVADYLAAAAVAALLAELETWPKPGLVSHVDSGSHTDMMRAPSEPARSLSRRSSVSLPSRVRPVPTWTGCARLASRRSTRCWQQLGASIRIAARSSVLGYSRGRRCRMVWVGACSLGLARQNSGRDRNPAMGACDIARSHPAAQSWDQCAARIWRGRCAGTGRSRISNRTRGRAARAAPRPPLGTWRSGGRSRAELLRNHGVDGGHQPASSPGSRGLALRAGRSGRVSPA